MEDNAQFVSNNGFWYLSLIHYESTHANNCREISIAST
jgi:hypothetical protein